MKLQKRRIERNTNETEADEKVSRAMTLAHNWLIDNYTQEGVLLISEASACDLISNYASMLLDAQTHMEHRDTFNESTNPWD